MIKRIFLDQNLNKYYKTEHNLEYLDNLNQLNIFIGANNTGKSRFLRSLFVDKEFRFAVSEFNSQKISIIFENILNEVDKEIGDIGYDELGSPNIASLKADLKRNIDKLNALSLRDINDVVNTIIPFWSWLKIFKATGASHKVNRISVGGSLERPTGIVNRIVSKYTDVLNTLIPDSFNYSNDRVYIPILRGLRPIQYNDNFKFDELHDNYLKRTIRDYFKEVQVKDEEIFTGLRLYNDTKKMLLGKQEERDKIKKFENFLSKTFFNNEPFSLIPNIEDDSIHVSIGSEEWPIYKLGDGIQSIIILLYPLFFNQGKKMMVFIEEPENSMHPGLQRLFLETIMQNSFKSFQYFITTHSNHFLDITLDLNKISVYSFAKVQTSSAQDTIYSIVNASNENSNVLDLIGARNSSVLLSNCTIWVEGITDRFYIKKYLEIYQSSLPQDKSRYKEDFNYSFIEYGGNNITHWAFGDESNWEKIKTNRISSKIYLIADKDSTSIKVSSEKAKRLNLLKTILNDNFQVVPGREIENILKPSILINTIKSLEKNNSVKLKFEENKITQKSYLEKPLGKYIQINFQNLSRKYCADSGTVFCKLDFCRAALLQIKTVEDFSNEALELTRKIYEFITQSHNH